MTVVLSGLIGQFSATYLHRERGFLRFFLLLHLFAFGSLLAFAAGSFDLLVAGWEMVGITSVLLIAFFQQRPAPVENGLRVFAVYRACDIGLLVGVFAMHHWAGTASFAGGLPTLTGSRSRRSSACFCCWRPPERPRRFRSRDGFHARWRAPRHRAPSSTARSRFTPARICCSGFNRCWRNPRWPPPW